MSKTFHDLKIGLDDELEEQLQWLAPNYSSYHVLKKSVDARRRGEPHFVYSVEVFGEGETPPDPTIQLDKSTKKTDPVLVIGAGPAGLFAALRLLERGIPCILIERGSPAEKRIHGINRFWRYGELDPNNNVCYGEGGAGLYSDGKLITRIKSPHIPYVMQRLIECGAPEEIAYLSNPHVGSDKIRRVIPKLRKMILDLGGDIRFDTPIERLLIEKDHVVGVLTNTGESIRGQRVILAIGHSADDFFDRLHEDGIFMEGKSFAMGLRIEHPQSIINHIQYRGHADHPKLGAANYKLTYHDKETERGIYSFCMCPGGYVLSSGTEADSLVCNGMSNYRRNSPYANAAMVVSVNFEKSFGTKDLFAGMKIRRQLELAAKAQVVVAGGTKELPAQKLTDFFEGRTGEVSKGSSPSGTIPARLDKVLGDELTAHLRKGLEQIGRKMNGFITDEAQLYGVESRTSCPLRITRDADTLQSVSHQGLYPAGEGAGYAGGITSAAVDGIKIADRIYLELNSQS